MKILIIRYKKTLGVPEGGEQGSEKNLIVLRQIALALRNVRETARAIEGAVLSERSAAARRTDPSARLWRSSVSAARSWLISSGWRMAAP